MLASCPLASRVLQVAGGTCVAFSRPDGDRLAVGCLSGQLLLLATTTLSPGGPEPGLTRCAVHATSRAGTAGLFSPLETCRLRHENPPLLVTRAGTAGRVGGGEKGTYRDWWWMEACCLIGGWW